MKNIKAKAEAILELAPMSEIERANLSREAGRELTALEAYEYLIRRAAREAIECSLTLRVHRTQMTPELKRIQG